jgi:hypothetical protein
MGLTTSTVPTGKACHRRCLRPWTDESPNRRARRVCARSAPARRYPRQALADAVDQQGWRRVAGHAGAYNHYMHQASDAACPCSRPGMDEIADVITATSLTTPKDRGGKLTCDVQITHTSPQSSLVFPRRAGTRREAIPRVPGQVWKKGAQPPDPFPIHPRLSLALRLDRKRTILPRPSAS